MIDPLPFVDIESVHTRAVLNDALALRLAEYGVGALDVSVVRGPNRRMTRAIAQWAYTQTDDDGNPLFSGIRYLSKHGAHECWAVFDGTDIEERAARSIDVTQPELIEVARTFNLTVN